MKDYAVIELLHGSVIQAWGFETEGDAIKFCEANEAPGTDYKYVVQELQ